MKKIPIAITIAGSDSGGGAGIEADLKTFTALGVHGAVALTSVTAQNTYEVTAIHDIPPEVVYEQIKAIAVDMGIDAGKTGMLSNSGIIRAVSRAVKEFSFPLVVDPVMVAKSGAKLLLDEAVEVLTRELIPLAKVVTPNAPEASRLSGVEVRDVDSAKQAARRIVEETGVEAAVVKGGHLLSDTSVDVMYWRGRCYLFESPRVKNGCTHGTGCSFSAAIAAELAKGTDLYNAVKVAKEFIVKAIAYGLKVGKGHCPVNPAAWLYVPAYRSIVLEELKRAVAKLMEHKGELIKYAPEVGINVAMSLPAPYALSVDDVAAVKGRIVRSGNELIQIGEVEFGASRHLARLILELQRAYPEVRAAVNVRYCEELVEKARKRGYRVVFIDRRLEPEESRRVEGATMRWIAGEVSRMTSEPPDIIYDVGDLGKEAMIRVIGKGALDAVDKLIKLIEEQ